MRRQRRDEAAVGVSAPAALLLLRDEYTDGLPPPLELQDDIPWYALREMGYTLDREDYECTS